jgi:hypothetical protein
MSTNALAAGRSVDLFKSTIDLIKADWLKLALATVVLGLVFGGAQKLLGATLGPIILPFASVPLFAGLMLLVRAAMERQSFDFAKLFSGFSNTSMLVNLLIIAVPSAILGVLQVLFVKSGMLILMLPLLLVLIAYTLIMMLAVQRVVFAGRDGVTALKEALPATVQNAIPLIVYILISFVALFLGILALIIGVFFAAPLVYGVVIRMHDEIFGNAQGLSVPPPFSG